MSNRDDNPIEILLVEDNPGDIRLTREAFGEVDLDVVIHAATTSDAALKFLYERVESETAIYPDMLLLDLNLPKDSGFTVLKALLDDPVLPQLPVITLTSSKAEEDVTKSYELRTSAYITKPSDPDEFVSIANALRDFWFETAHLPPK